MIEVDGIDADCGLADAEFVRRRRQRAGGNDFELLRSAVADNARFARGEDALGTCLRGDDGRVLRGVQIAPQVREPVAYLPEAPPAARNGAKLSPPPGGRKP